MKTRLAVNMNKPKGTSDEMSLSLFQNFMIGARKSDILAISRIKIQKNSYDSHLVVGMPELLRTLCHSSGVSFPSPFLSARVNIFRI